VTRLPKGDALVATLSMTAKGLTHPLTVTGGALVSDWSEPLRANHGVRELCSFRRGRLEFAGR